MIQVINPFVKSIKTILKERSNRRFIRRRPGRLIQRYNNAEEPTFHLI